MLSHSRPRASPANGHTLIELLLAVGIVGILIAVALPYYGDYKERIRTNQAAEDIVALSVLVQTYMSNNHGYPESLSDINMAEKLDPWGRPYAYYNIDAHGKGHARKDHALNPLNTDFDLYSLGHDGISASQITQKASLDDVIRAGNGGFVGIAATF
jgi:general secretion pathway protein G